MPMPCQGEDISVNGSFWPPIHHLPPKILYKIFMLLPPPCTKWYDVFDMSRPPSSPKPQPWDWVQISLTNHNLLHLARSEQSAQIRTTWARYPRLLTSHCPELHTIWTWSGPFLYAHGISDMIFLLTTRTTCSDMVSSIGEECWCSCQVQCSCSHTPVLIICSLDLSVHR